VSDSIRIRRLQAIGEREIQGLSDVLIDCVEGGASVSFMLPMPRAKAEEFWRAASLSSARGERVVLAAEDAAEAIVGTVQLILAQPENQPHRADLAKMLVHRRVRRRGVGAALLAAATSRPEKPPAQKLPEKLPHGLTLREAEILSMIARGMTNPDIAAELYISTQTIKSHINRIFAKTGSANRTAAIRYARDHHLG